MTEPLADCECGRGPVSVVAFSRNTSLLVRRIEDMGHASAADWRCVDCVADMADEVAASPMRSSHPDAPALRPPTPDAPPHPASRESEQAAAGAGS